MNYPGSTSCSSLDEIQRFPSDSLSPGNPKNRYRGGRKLAPQLVATRNISQEIDASHLYKKTYGITRVYIQAS